MNFGSENELANFIWQLAKENEDTNKKYVEKVGANLNGQSFEQFALNNSEASVRKLLGV